MAPSSLPAIRSAKSADTDAILRLLDELGYSPDTGQFGATFAEALSSPVVEVLVAAIDEQIVGLLTLSLRPRIGLGGLLASIDELVVTDGARSTGIGRALLDSALGLARKAGARRIELTTNRRRESYRRAFYVKNGFREVDSAVLRVEDVL